MISLVSPALRLLLLMSVLLGAVYPLLVTGLTQHLFPVQAQGSLVFAGVAAPSTTPGTTPGTGPAVLQGSALIGQSFAGPRYFWSRPSATTPAYNAAASSGSNLGPTNPAQATAVKARIDTLRASAHGTTDVIPVDLVTTSGSGLDPHISPAAAHYQIARVAAERGLAPAVVAAQVADATEGRQWGVLGEPRVNVLMLNRALDALTAAH